jgi:rubrerythrin
MSPPCSVRPPKARPATPTATSSTWSSVGDPATGLPFGGTSENLKTAIAGETHEYTDMYPGMAKTARDEGHDEIADWFETLAKAERSHANRFQKALDQLND